MPAKTSCFWWVLICMRAFRQILKSARKPPRFRSFRLIPFDWLFSHISKLTWGLHVRTCLRMRDGGGPLIGYMIGQVDQPIIGLDIIWSRELAFRQDFTQENWLLVVQQSIILKRPTNRSHLHLPTHFLKSTDWYRKSNRAESRQFSHNISTWLMTQSGFLALAVMAKALVHGMCTHIDICLMGNTRQWRVVGNERC